MGAAGSVVLGGRYVLGEKIGAGGSSEVWCATDLVLSRRVAIKLPRLGNAEVLTRFRAEAQHAGGLSHENIARIYDYGESAPPQPPFLVMELVDGPSLAGALAAGPLDPARCLEVVAQTACGLHAAHLAGLVHRDIKPANLLLAPGGLVKITDFGIAQATDATAVTGTGQLLGTPGYLAPERAMGASATSASDLYALGIVAYECLAGAPPFTGPALAVALAHQERALPPLPCQVPREVAALVLELTAKDPADRPCSAGEVARWAGHMAARMAAGAAARAGSMHGDSAVTAAERAARYPGMAPGAAAVVPVPGSAAAPPAPDLARGPAAPVPVPAAEMLTEHLRARRAAAPRHRAWHALRRAMLPAAAAIVVIATAFLIGSAIAPGPAPHAGTVPSATPSGPARPGPAQDATVEVRPGPLIGLPVAAAVHRLHQQGLSVRVVWRRSGTQPPGTVLAVRPAGQRPVGSTVVLTGATPMPHHGHKRDGHQQGDGAQQGGDQPGGASHGRAKSPHGKGPARGPATHEGVLSALSVPAAG
jgi:eukaryotic-like serine/threonine-protein kinase